VEVVVVVWMWWGGGGGGSSATHLTELRHRRVLRGFLLRRRLELRVRRVRPRLGGVDLTVGGVETLGVLRAPLVEAAHEKLELCDLLGALRLARRRAFGLQL